MAISDILALPFRNIYLVDTEYVSGPRELPDPHCVVAREVRSNRLVRMWRDEFWKGPPYGTGDDSLFVVYTGSAEIGTHLALRWGPIPVHILDLYAEFRCLYSGYKETDRGAPKRDTDSSAR